MAGYGATAKRPGPASAGSAGRQFAGASCWAAILVPGTDLHGSAALPLHEPVQLDAIVPLEHDGVPIDQDVERQHPASGVEPASAEVVVLMF